VARFGCFCGAEANVSGYFCVRFADSDHYFTIFGQAGYTANPFDQSWEWRSYQVIREEGFTEARMRHPRTDTVNRRLVENVRLSQRVRLAALDSISHPPLALLLRLLKNPATPTRLIGLAAAKYQGAILRRNIAKLPVQERRKLLAEIVRDPANTQAQRDEALSEWKELRDPLADTLLGIRSDRPKTEPLSDRRDRRL
jgi:hypothetical protein